MSDFELEPRVSWRYRHHDARASRMVWNWLRDRRRRTLREAAFPSAWETTLRRNVKHAAWLDEHDSERLRRFIKVFLSEKRFEGCRGLEITDEVRVTVAGLAGVAMLGFVDEYFDHVRSLLIYPGDYRAPKSTALDGGGLLEWEEPRLGETWVGGSMVLAWPRVVDGGRFRASGSNVVVHEWAHAYDMAAGEADGVPPMGSPQARDRFAKSLTSRFRAFLDDLDQGRPCPLDEYAGESLAEFFAVASEWFFQDPHRLARYDERLTALLVEAWRQDPRRWMPRNLSGRFAGR